ncbi:hypothetical protein GOBAR_DD33476 [Gossypium barbadense]|nr:hypothetical protein GOBAR_DD33476 [Gossypium barbadense]
MGSKSSDQKPRAKHRKGLWSPEEDLKLRNYVLKHGHGCWTSVAINAVISAIDTIIKHEHIFLRMGIP